MEYFENEYFKNESCLLLTMWINSGIKYVKDLVNKNGELFSDVNLFTKIPNYPRKLHDIFIVNKYVLKKLKGIDVSNAPYTKIQNKILITVDNKNVLIDKQKSGFFYNILCDKKTTRGNMQSVFSREFNFENTHSFWSKIYIFKVLNLKIPKLAEFNFKLLHNIIPNGIIVSKWNKEVGKNCQYCNESESTKHMLFECKRVKIIWKNISNVVNVNITWKQIICGFPMFVQTQRFMYINFVITATAYAIFKKKSYCKFNKMNYAMINLKYYVKNQTCKGHLYLLFFSQ